MTIHDTPERLRAIEYRTASLHNLYTLHSVETHHIEVAHVIERSRHAINKDERPILNTTQVYARVARDPRLSVGSHIGKVHAILEFQCGDHIASARLF